MSRQEIINAEMHLANKVQNGAYLADCRRAPKRTTGRNHERK